MPAVPLIAQLGLRIEPFASGYTAQAGDVAFDATTGRLQAYTNLFGTVEPNFLDGASAKQFHGFPLNASGNRLVSLSYDPATRKLTITALASSTFYVWFQGAQLEFNSPYETPAHADADGQHFFLIDSVGNLTVRTTAWRLRTEVPIAYVIYNQGLTDGAAFYELHDYLRDPQMHAAHHFSVGAQIQSGAAISGYTLSPAVPTDADNTFAIASSVLRDEDITYALTALPDDGPYTIFWRSGAAGAWTWSKTNALPFLVDANSPRWNEFTGATWQLTTSTTDNRWINYWVVGVPGLETEFQHIVIVGQTVHTSLANAQAESYANLAFGDVAFQEIAPLYKVTYRFSTGYSSTGRVRIENVERLITTKASLVAGAAAGSHQALSNRSDFGSHPVGAIDFSALGESGEVPFLAAGGLMASDASFLYDSATGDLDITGIMNAASFYGISGGLLGTGSTMLKVAVPSTYNSAKLEATWNDGSSPFTGLLIDITDTLSDATSLALDIQVDAVSIFSISKAGKMTVAGLIDPTGLQFDPAAANPGNAYTLWVDSENGNILKFGATAVIGGGGVTVHNDLSGRSTAACHSLGAIGDSTALHSYIPFVSSTGALSTNSSFAFYTNSNQLTCHNFYSTNNATVNDLDVFRDMSLRTYSGNDFTYITTISRRASPKEYEDAHVMLPSGSGYIAVASVLTEDSYTQALTFSEGGSVQTYGFGTYIESSPAFVTKAITGVRKGRIVSAKFFVTLYELDDDGKILNQPVALEILASRDAFVITGQTAPLPLGVSFAVTHIPDDSGREALLLEIFGAAGLYSVAKALPQVISAAPAAPKPLDALLFDDGYTYSYHLLDEENQTIDQWETWYPSEDTIGTYSDYQQLFISAKLVDDNGTPSTILGSSSGDYPDDFIFYYYSSIVVGTRIDTVYDSNNWIVYFTGTGGTLGQYRLYYTDNAYNITDVSNLLPSGAKPGPIAYNQALGQILVGMTGSSGTEIVVMKGNGTVLTVDIGDSDTYNVLAICDGSTSSSGDYDWLVLANRASDYATYLYGISGTTWTDLSAEVAQGISASTGAIVCLDSSCYFCIGDQCFNTSSSTFDVIDYYDTRTVKKARVVTFYGTRYMHFNGELITEYDRYYIPSGNYIGVKEFN